MSDRIILCMQCEKPFVITAQEHARLRGRGFDIPKRCPECRRHKFRLPQNDDTDRDVRKKRRRSRDQFPDEM